MSNEKLSPRPIIPIKQSLEASCVVASVTMVLRGFGISVDEQTLIEKYFPTAKLSATNRDAGVTKTNTVKGMVQILKDMELENDLQIDIFVPNLHEYVRSPENRYIVRAQPKVLQIYRNRFQEKGEDEIRGFYTTLEDLATKDEVGIYTANARMMGFNKKQKDYPYLDVPDIVKNNFYIELTEFARKGHIVGPHGGMTRHVRVLDGVSRVELQWISSGNFLDTKEEGFMIVDPRGDSYPASIDHLIWVDSFGVSGDSFDYLFRVSPKTELIDSQQYGSRPFLQNLRRYLSR